MTFVPLIININKMIVKHFFHFFKKAPIGAFGGFKLRLLDHRKSTDDDLQLLAQ